MEPEESRFGPGDSFGVEIKLNVDRGCINTVEGFIKFPAGRMNVIDFVTGSSFLNLWVDKPSQADLLEINSMGELYFAGGVPGGYCGRIPGDPGESNIVGKIIFKIPGLVVASEKKEYLDVVISQKSRVFLNDGLGTADIVKTRNARYYLADKSVGDGQGWKDYILSDKIPPEPFIVELHQDDRVYDGRYYIIFSTVDKQSGVDRYEILEIRPEEQIGTRPQAFWWEKFLGRERPAPDWQIGKMPYLLKDQTLSSIVKVRAVDKAGNERLVEYVPPLEAQLPARTFPIKFIIMAAAGFIILVIIVILIIKKLKRKKYHEEEISSAEQNHSHDDHE